MDTMDRQISDLWAKWARQIRELTAAESREAELVEALEGYCAWLRGTAAKRYDGDLDRARLGSDEFARVEGDLADILTDHQARKDAQ